jgi:hypothetical protein
MPEGITIEDISQQIRNLLERENSIDVIKAANEKIWAGKTEEWIERPSKKP